MDQVIHLSIELHSPLLSGDWRMGNVYETLPYLPGSALRGALADALMQDWGREERRRRHPDECDDADCGFCHVFFPNAGMPPRFGDCHPALNDDRPLPFPVTARTCKYDPGFIEFENPDKNHGIFDILIRQVCFEDALSKEASLHYLYDPRCPTCGEKVQPQGGHYAMNGGRYYTANPYNRRFSRTAVNRVRGAVEHKLLFTLEVIGEQMRLWEGEESEPVEAITTLEGDVWVDEANAQAVRNALERIEWIGAVRSRGLGRVRVSASEPETPRDLLEGVELFLKAVQTGEFELPPRLARREARGEPLQPQTLVERLLAFNRALQEERDFWKAMNVDVLPGAWYFTLDLLSDTFLRDEMGLPTLQLSPKLAGLTERGAPKVTKVRSWVTRIYRSGWSGVKKLPRPVRLGVKAGSVYLYRVDEVAEATNRAILEALAHLEKMGVGEDLERGAGRILACTPFHLEVEPR